VLGDFVGGLPAKLAAQLDRVAFRPDSLGADTVMALALTPPLLAGLVLFRLPALEILAIAVGVGGTVHLLARVLHQPLVTSPVLPAIVGVALCGPGSPLLWPLAIALATSGLEVARGRLVPQAGIHTGVLSYSILFLASGGAMASYLKPAGMIRFPEPIQQWSRFYGGANHFLEPSTLYVGNVAGPVLATSLLAVVISLAWLWYARRLSLSVIVAFAVGGAGIATALHWDPVFQLDSGPAWFVVGLALADRRLLPAEPYGRPVLGFAAGIVGVGLRAGHFYVEGLFLTAAAIQVVFALVEGLVRLVAPRLESRAGLRPEGQKEPASA
jgi:hypothetical protein